MSTTQSHESDLREALAYLQDLDAELEERSPVRDQRANSSAREDIFTNSIMPRNSLRSWSATRPTYPA
jgi:hypothetical protein